MTVIFVITKKKYFNVIEETAQTMCMDFYVYGFYQWYCLVYYWLSVSNCAGYVLVHI